MTELSPSSEVMARLKDIHLRLHTFTNPPTHPVLKAYNYSPLVVETDVSIQIKKAQFELEKAIQMLNEKTTKDTMKNDYPKHDYQK